MIGVRRPSAGYIPGRPPTTAGAHVDRRNAMIVLGIVLLILGLLVASLKILVTIGIILLVVGLVLNLVPIGGSRRRVY